MKTTVDIPEEALRDAMRYSKAKTKREAILAAVEEYNRRRRVEGVVADFGTLEFASNDEIEAGDLEKIARCEAGRKSR